MNRKPQMSLTVKGIFPPACWHGDNCLLVNFLFYSRLLEGWKDLEFESKRAPYRFPEKTIVIDQWLAYLNWPICEHTDTHRHTRVPVQLEGHVFTLCSRCLRSGYLLLQATLQIPAGIPGRLLARVERRGPSKCAAKFASPARWDTLCMALQRGYASPTGPGRGDSRSANVRQVLNVLVTQMPPWKLSDFILLEFGFEFGQQWNENLSGLCLFLCNMWSNTLRLH